MCVNVEVSPAELMYLYITSVTRAFGRDFASTVEMLKYSPALFNMHNIVVWKYELSLQSNHTARVRAQTLISL